jgi:hypothetical protein
LYCPVISFNLVEKILRFPFASRNQCGDVRRTVEESGFEVAFDSIVFVV